ncbi:hypothetical protein SmJEL517_g02851 [Synchytrium microbalum]|uniref:Spt20-like SEP domain-containing protein n=1 Tax=Synchytrium microbalum TaxID=1806994 RepID=A0A507CAP1_9FUNG|nr:uncharacterized protein SmJEL517_g02851 [Synchytrium microbalum]TPX34585.1 hypothetical protein SmJEL517_g02851 [Synchytrium microbalum]
MSTMEPPTPTSNQPTPPSSNATSGAVAPIPRLRISLKPPKFPTAAPGMTIHLHPTHFNIQNSDATYQYNGPLNPFIQAVNKQQLTPDVLKYADNFHNGMVVARIHDHRLGVRPVTAPPAVAAHTPITPTFPTTTTLDANGGAPPVASPAPEPIAPQIFSIELRPTMQTLWSTMSSLSATNPSTNENGEATPWTMDFATRVEAAILPRTEPPLCLDPSTKVVRLANQIAFNEQKFLVRPKRKRNWAEVEEEETKKKKESSKLLMFKEDRHEFHPRFSRFSYIEDWRKKKTMADMELLAGVDTKQKSKRQKLHLNAGKKLVRTVRWERESEKGKVYTIMNIYENSPTDYEAVFRAGNVEGTSTGNGMTLKYPIGNATAVDYYLAHLKGFYAIEKNNLVADVPLAKVAPTGSSSSGGGTPSSATPNPGSGRMTPGPGLPTPPSSLPVAGQQQQQQRPGMPGPATGPSRPTPSLANQAKMIGAYGGNSAKPRLKK